jgi:hypothetical protein
MRFAVVTRTRGHARALAALLIASGISVAWAQAPTAPAVGADIGRLQQRIAALEQRLKQMEQKLAGGSTVKAPFTVTDDDGNAVLRITSDEGAQLTFGGDAKAPAFHVRDSDDEVAVLVNGISGHVLLSAGRDGAALVETASQGTTFARLKADADGGASAQVLQGAGVAGISIHENQPSVHLAKAGKQFFSVSSKSDTQLRLGDDTQPLFSVKGSADQSILQLAKGLTLTASQSGRGKLQLNSTANKAAVMLDTGQGAGSLEIFDANKRLARLDASRGGGSLELFDAEGLAARLDADVGSGALELYDGQKPVARLGKGSNGNSVFRLMGKAGADVVALGEDTKGNGAVWINHGSGSRLASIYADADGETAINAHDAAGKVVATMAVGADGGGAFQILNGSGQIIGSIGQGQNGGMLQLNNMTGAPMVEAGNTGSVGVVRAGPIIRTGGAMLGLPGSFILGRTK